MIYIILQKYKEKLGWDISTWKFKKKKFKAIMKYDLNRLMFFNWFLGKLNVEGHKSKSFYFLINILITLKNKKNKDKYSPFLLFSLLVHIKQNILLFNKRKGSVFYELPRFITMEQSIKKVIEWLIIGAKKRKRNFFKNLRKEVTCIFYKNGEIFKRKQYIKNTMKKNRPFFYLLKKKKR